MLITIIASLAVLFQSIRIIPQVIKGFTTKSVRDVALAWEIIGTISTILWLIYGFMKLDYAIIAGNAINLVCYILLLIQKKMFSKKLLL